MFSTPVILRHLRSLTRRRLLLKWPSSRLYVLIPFVIVLLYLFLLLRRRQQPSITTTISTTTSGSTDFLPPSFDAPHLNESQTSALRIVLIVPPFTYNSAALYTHHVLSAEHPTARPQYNPSTLLTFLTSLSSANYDNDPIDLDILLAPHANTTTLNAAYDLVTRANWPHGSLTVHNLTSGGLFEVPISAWNPSHSNVQYGPPPIILDASQLHSISGQFHRYIKSVRNRYSTTADIAAFALEPVVVHQDASISSTPLRVPLSNVDEVFLYQNFPFVPAFTPANAATWRTFHRWFYAHRAEWFLWPTVVGAKDKKDAMWNSFSGTMRAHWTLWFSRFCAEYELYVAYPRKQNPEALSVVEKASVVTDLLRYDFEGKTVVRHETINSENLESIVELGRQQGGSVSLTIVNEAFLETAKSWICNVDVAGIRPPGVVWIATDDVAYEGLKAINDCFTVRMDEFRGGKAKTGTSYGTPGYWRLMLERTQLIDGILQHGIGVFAFETDQIWLRDPVPFVRRMIRSGDEVDVVGTLDTRHEIGGNFLYLNPTLATRRTWKEVCRRFKKAYERMHMDRHSAKFKRYIENDQSTLTKLIFYDEEFKTKNPVVFRTLDIELFVDGRWYDKTRKFYTSKKSRSPIVINNNFLVGIENKKIRAAQHGHWFITGKVCNAERVRAAVSENEARSSAYVNNAKEIVVKNGQSEEADAMAASRLDGADVEAGLEAAISAIRREHKG